MSGHHHLSKKEQKKARQKKNLFHMQIFNQLRLRRAEEARVKSLSKALNAKKSSPKPNAEWSDKVATVRNRLTGKKRESKERWNRFAGTSDAGGRGL